MSVSVTSSRHKTIGYRPDIDGLRAIAVLPVVAFHLRLPIFRGGFVGVDVFFVISGYLIGSIILREVDNGSFTFTNFYRRRISRILPALLAVMLFTLVLAWVYTIPNDFHDVAVSVICALFSVSNIYFWTKSNYFDDALASDPMLHTWSLGVEEQFYILFPLVVILCSRYLRKHKIQIFSLISILSLVASIAAVSLYPDAAFYLLPFRWFELGIGVMAASGVLPSPKGLLRECLSPSGSR